MSAYGKLYEGKAQAQAAEAEARQREIQAGQERAVAQHNAARMREQARRLLSKQRVAAAASGFDVNDNTSQALVADTVTAQSLEELLVQAQAEGRARQMEYSATLKRIEGKQAKKASRIAAGATLLSSVASAAGQMPQRPTAG